MSSKKKSLAGRLLKYVTVTCGCCAAEKPRKRIKAHRKAAVLCAGAILTRQRGGASTELVELLMGHDSRS